ncbi:hypothetical protein [Streptomyces sp. bgisy153]|uniref:hypothetical protein n=1 Tax=Streptomyces sp. bgisy153 TaxID=3413793 RepID=UPI003D754734
MSPKDVARRETSTALTWGSAKDLPQLELDDLKDETEESLVARGATYVREIVRIENATTILYKNVAVTLLALRRQMGDWRGEGYEYRQKVNEMYRQAGIDDDPDSKRIKGNVRWHVGNALRRYLTPRELKRAGLLPESPLERGQDNRATQSAIVRATRAIAAAEQPKPAKSSEKAPRGEVKADAVPSTLTGAEVKATADQLRLAQVASGILAQMSEGAIADDMTRGQRTTLDKQLAAMEERIRALRELTRAKSRS